VTTDETRERQVHGGLVEVLGSGVLLTGPSGVGKSETALELVARGHRLVADDVVILTYEAGRLRGRSPATIRHHLEIRGIGIVYLPDLYGPDSVRDDGPVDLVCHLEHWKEGAAYERVGLDRPQEDWCGVMLPALVLPVRPSANMATLVEVAVRDEQQRQRGPSGADRLDARLQGRS
jgi:HPr kinase/phosphorylase